MELTTSSISNEIDKSIQEEFSVSQAAIDEIRKRREKGQKPESISNEEIRKGDPILDTYKVLDDAIHGGMGSVWRVHHESWNVDLAMKRPQPRFFAEAGDGRKEEFIRECENWINLGLHPNIVSCYYVREIGNVPTIFSEWMDNGSLKDRIRDGSLYEGTEEEVQERILDIAIQTARGLEYSHENGLIHQDVKPGNILLTKGWDAKVADFGLAKAQSQLRENEKPVSTGYTIQYCPREQSEGAPAEKWMDVYAWALTIVEVLCGKRFWNKGQEVEIICGNIERFCKVSVPLEFKNVLIDCIQTRNKEQEIERDLLKIFRVAFGKEYERIPFRDVDLSADTLNNKALSLFDLGKKDKSDRIWQEAIKTDHHHRDTVFNYALFQWRTGCIDPVQAIRKLRLAYSEDQYHEDENEILRECGNNGVSSWFNVRDEIAETIKESHFEDLKHSTKEMSEKINGQCQEILGRVFSFTESISYIFAATNAKNAFESNGKMNGATLLVFSKNTEKLLDMVHWADTEDVLYCGAVREMVAVGDMLVMRSEKRIRTYLPETKEVWVVDESSTFLEISPQGDLLATGGWDEAVRVFSLPKLESIFTCNAHENVIEGGAFSHDGSMLATYDMNGALRIWSIPAGRCIKAYLGKGASTPVTFSKDDRNLLIHYSDHTNVVPIGPFTYKASWRLSQISTTDKALQLKRKYEQEIRMLQWSL